MALNFAAKAAITVALTAANMALTMSRKIEGPRLDSTKFTGGDYGADLPTIWGMRRMEVPIFWAENLREVKRRRKTKGGKFNEYTYYGTWAVALAGHEIEAVRRIWFDTHLVYDVSGAGPVTPFDFGATGDISEAIAIYLGTDTQEPDPRMQATVEAEFGEGSCPAYRDTAYVVFKDIPLEKLGNRIPQVSVEILGAAADNFPFDTTTGIGGSNLAFSPDYTTLLTSSGITGTYGVIDVAARALMVSGSASISTEDNSAGHGFLADGTILMSQPASGNVFSTPFGTSTSAFLDPEVNSLLGTITNVVDDDGQDHWLTSFPPFYTYSGVERDTEDDFGFAVWFSMILRDTDGSIWIVGNKAHGQSTVIFHRVQGSGTGPGTLIVEGLPDTASEVAFHYADDTTDHFVLGKGGDLFRIERETGDILGSNTSVYASGLTVNAFRAIAPGARSFYVGFAEYLSADLSLVRQLSYDDWHPGTGVQDLPTVYDPINHALLTIGGGSLTRNYLDRVGNGEVLLSTICGDVADMCGVDTYDFSDLDQTITGWSATRGQASNMLEPLLDAYDSDIRPHDFGIEGIKRTGVTNGSAIATAWLVGQPRYGITVRQELPRALLIDFADIDADQQPNTARADRPLDATDARGERKFDLTTLALDTDEAIQLANRHFRRIWNERQEVSTALTAKELSLEPGDVRSITLDGTTRSYRCTSLIIKADDTLATEWRYDHPSLATLDGSAGATFDGREPSVVAVPLLSKGFVLDIPLLSDADDATPPQVYTLAAPFADGAWPGATIYQEVDGEYTEELATVASSGAAVWGYVSTALPYANPNLWDRGTSITVTLQTGSLTGCTEAAANADPSLNLAAIGADGRWEIVQFTVATLTAPLTYTLSGFKRGRRGTEWAAELHAAGDQFVLLENADAQAMGLSEVGTDVSFKPITSGRTTGFPFGYEYQGQSLKPYAPAHLEAVKETNGDWTFSWVRRTRVGGAWTSGSTIPLGEATEEYEITVGDGTDSDTITVTDSEYTWTLADQTTLTGGEVLAGDLEWAVAQVSASVGAGFLATA